MMMGPVERAFEKGRNSIVQLHQKSRSAAAPAVKKAKITLSLGASRGTTGLRSFYTGQLRPALRTSGDWLAQRLNPRSLRQDYAKGLLLVHRLGADKKIERLLFIPTAKTVPLSVVRVPHQLRRSGHDYRPTPWHVFHWAMKMIPDPLETICLRRLWRRAWPRPVDGIALSVRKNNRRGSGGGTAPGLPSQHCAILAIVHEMPRRDLRTFERPAPGHT